MILFISALISFIFFLGAFLVLYAFHSPRARVQRKLSLMIREAEAERSAEEEEKKQAAKLAGAQEKHRALGDIPLRERVLSPLLQGMEGRLLKLAPRELYGLLEHLIFLAGKQEKWSVSRVAASWVLSVFLGLCLALVLIAYTELQLPQQLALLLLCMGLGAVMPVVFLRSLIRQRKGELRRQLPDFLDLLCTSVQAGLSFDAAVAKITGRMKGTLVEEFSRMLRDTSLGMTRQHALTQLARRCDIEEIYLFTSSVIQADKLGTSMGRTLKIQADNIRDRHRQRVRTKAMKAPVKMLFPMVIFIFPSIFVMVLLPALLALGKSLAK